MPTRDDAAFNPNPNPNPNPNLNPIPNPNPNPNPNPKSGHDRLTDCLSELALQEAGEWTDPDSEQGSVFYDSEPDEPDIPSNSGGTLGERLGF